MSTSGNKNKTIRLYETNGDTLLMSDGVRVVAGLEHLDETRFERDASTWQEWAERGEWEDYGLRELEHPGVRLVATYNTETGEVKKFPACGATARRYLAN